MNNELQKQFMFKKSASQSTLLVYELCWQFRYRVYVCK